MMYLPIFNTLVALLGVLGLALAQDSGDLLGPIQAENGTVQTFSCSAPTKTNVRCDYDAIDEGAEMLEGMTVRCKLRKGAEERVWCSDNAAIWLKNESDGDLDLNCKVISDHVKNLQENCSGDKQAIRGMSTDTMSFVVTVAETNWKEDEDEKCDIAELLVPDCALPTPSNFERHGLEAWHPAAEKS
ncbi:hypothetical protein MKZ38_005746 [Zalerion maritima]|uniref:Uncharacterized protein n=1 Tax=Zalerion maritima TaxID=339359 RepID=A0AAD5RKQ2_9PEZI|nr:hypothetical protein MKZ38_005746 [Zalerion maritima]